MDENFVKWIIKSNIIYFENRKYRPYLINSQYYTFEELINLYKTESKANSREDFFPINCVDRREGECFNTEGPEFCSSDRILPNDCPYKIK
jgi:hypothetical protein